MDIVGKVFPKLRRKGSRFSCAGSATNKDESVSEDVSCETNTSDFVFRIVYSNYSRTYAQGKDYHTLRDLTCWPCSNPVFNAFAVEEMFEDPPWRPPSTPKSAIPPVTPRSTPLHSVSTTSSTSSSKSLDQQPSVQEQGYVHGTTAIAF